MTAKQIGYQIVVGKTVQELCKNVLDCQEQGWITQGGMKTIVDGYNAPYQFYQTMIVEEGQYRPKDK